MTRVLRIAAADDEPDVREYYERILPRLGHEVAGVAGTGAELVRLCAETNPDLVITDLKMPDMDGFEAVRRIRAERGSDLPVIVLSGYREQEHVEAASAMRVQAYLVKPVTRAELDAAIRAAT